MTSIVLNVTFDCADPRALARFWGAVTGWPVDEEPGNEFCLEISRGELDALIAAERAEAG